MLSTTTVRYRGPVPDDRPYHHGNLRAALLDAAERGLREHGVDQVALRDLARELGVSHGAPRRHFPNRQALLDALAETGFIRLDTTLATALARAGDDFPSRLRAAMTAMTRFSTENAALVELMYTRKHRPDAPRIATAAEAPIEQLRDLIVQGQAQGALQDGDPERIGIVLYATMQGIVSIINSQVVEPERLDEIVETAAEQFLRGARPLD
jgi:AcrR family transcriptional regulator